MLDILISTNKLANLIKKKSGIKFQIDHTMPFSFSSLRTGNPYQICMAAIKR